jgi:hypothetical protein
MGSGLGCGMAAMNNVVSCLGFILFCSCESWDSFSYTALSLSVCYRAGMCMDLSVDLLHSVRIKRILCVS